MMVRCGNRLALSVSSGLHYPPPQRDRREVKSLARKLVRLLNCLTGGRQASLHCPMQFPDLTS